MTDLECQIASQALSLKILHAEKEHSVMLTHHTPSASAAATIGGPGGGAVAGLTNQMSQMHRHRHHMRPRSAESARKPKYKMSSDFKPLRGLTIGRNPNSEFSIMLPGSGVDVLDLDESPEVELAQRTTLSLGPMVVTDDEYATNHEVGKASGISGGSGGSGKGGVASSGSGSGGGGGAGKHQRCLKLKRGHRRTASTGSNVVPVGSKEREAVGPKSSNPISGGFAAASSSSAGAKMLLHPPPPSLGSKGGGVGGGGAAKGGKYPRPGSAGSSRQTEVHHGHVRQPSGVVVGGGAEQRISKTAHELSEYMHSLIDDHAHSRSRDHAPSSSSSSSWHDKSGKDAVSSAGKDSSSERGKDHSTSSSSTATVSAAITQDDGSNTLKASGGGGGSAKVKGRFEASSARNKPANKSTDSNETTSSEGNGFSSKGSSQSDSSNGTRQDSKGSADFPHRHHHHHKGSGFGGMAAVAGNRHAHKGDQHQQQSSGALPATSATELSRRESMSSTCSTLSTFGTSTLPSRNHSFTYDGGESSTYSHESLEIGDSVENLQVCTARVSYE